MEFQFGGWVLEVKSTGITMASYIVACDAKGSVPAWIVNQLSEDAGKVPLYVSKFMKEKYGNYVPMQQMKSKVKHLARIQGDDDGLLHGTEDDMDESIEDSSDESLDLIAENPVTETQSSTPLIQIGEGSLRPMSK